LTTTTTPITTKTKTTTITQTTNAKQQQGKQQNRIRKDTKDITTTRTRYTKPGEQQLSVCPWAWLDHRYLDMNSILHETLMARGGGASEVERVDLFAWR